MVSNLNLLESRRRILLNTPHIETVSDTIASFKTDVATKLKGCKIHFTPIQEGEGDPSPENVRPITGWDGVTVTKCGKNLIPETSDGNFWQHGWINSNGIAVNLTRTDYFQNVNNPIPIKAGSYTLSTASISWKGMCLYDKNKNKVYFKEGNVKTITLTASENGYIAVYVINNHTNLQLEFGSEATDYEPYTETSLTIPFPQTIYGGYVDLVKGEVVEEWDKTTFGANWSYANAKATNVFVKGFSSRQPTLSPYDSNIICDSYKVIRTYPISQYNLIPDISVCGRSTYSHLIVRDDRFSTKEDFSATASETEFAYILATPKTYPIDPQTLKALRGMNNIWSDANGNVEVSFYTH